MGQSVIVELILDSIGLREGDILCDWCMPEVGKIPIQDKS